MLLRRRRRYSYATRKRRSLQRQQQRKRQGGKGQTQKRKRRQQRNYYLFGGQGENEDKYLNKTWCFRDASSDKSTQKKKKIVSQPKQKRPPSPQTPPPQTSPPPPGSPSSSSSKPIGIANCGNSCYINSVIQFLAASDDFVNALEKHVQTHNDDPILTKFSDLIQKLKRKEEITEIDIVPLVDPDRFNQGEQQDASEFLNSYLEKIQLPSFELKSTNVYKYKLKKEMITQYSKEFFHQQPEVTYMLIPMGYLYEYQTNIKLQKLLEDQYITFSDTEDVIDDIKDDIKRKRNITDITNSQINNEYTIQKKSRLTKLSDNIIIELGRYRNQNGQLGKVKTRVMIPQNFIIDFSPYVENPEQTPLNYRLTGVILHRGSGESLRSGHYIAIIFKNGTWYELNDSVVTTLSPSDALQEIQGTKSNYNEGYQSAVIYMFHKI